MAYFAPYIDSTGLHMPKYEDLLSALTERQYRRRSESTAAGANPEGI